MRQTAYVRPLSRPCVAAALWMALTIVPAHAAQAPTAAAGKAEAAAAVKREAAPQTGLIRGYYEHRDGGLFTACGETSRRRVRMPKAPGFLADALASGGDKARFLIARGNLVGQDGAELFGLDLITTDAFDCESRLDPLLYGGRGSVSLWALEITPAKITFTSAPGASAEVFPNAALVAQGSTRVAEVANAHGTLRIELRAEACAETMTGTVFGLSAKITTGGKTYSGCAWRGLADG